MATPRARLAILALALGITCAAHRKLPLTVSGWGDERFVPRPELARLAAFGFEAVLADYYWLEAVQVVGGERVDPSRHGPLIGRLVDVTTTLDPWVDHPYRFAALWMTTDRETVREANRLLERGIAHHPDDWRNRFYLGFNHYYYLGDKAGAVSALETAIVLERAPFFLRRLVARLRADTDSLEAAATFLQELVRTAPDAYARAEYEKALDEIEAERRARLLDRARAEYRRRTGRDIEAVEDLMRPPHPVLRALPPEPNGWEWILDEKSGRIVSSYYKRRYEPAFDPGGPRWRHAPENRQQGEPREGA